MTIPATLPELINTAGLYDLTSLEISIMIQQFAKNNKLKMTESNEAITLFKRGVEPVSEGYLFFEVPQLVYNLKTRLFVIGCNFSFPLN
jgi:hypothetical protein